MTVNKEKLGMFTSVTVDDSFYSVTVRTNGEEVALYVFDGVNKEMVMDGEVLSMLRCALAVLQYEGDYDVSMIKIREK